MGIVDEDVVRVREASDLVAVIGDHVQLKRVGRRWQGLCPFHSEKTPSFSVNQEQGFYYCFGCGAKGDAITFVREVEHLDFVGAVELLASKAGIALRYTDRDQGEGRKRRAKLVDAVAKAVEWYHDRLLTSPDAGRARGYLRERDLDGDDVRAYKIGWAPEGWDELARALKVPDDVLYEAGLARKNSRGRPTDFFRGRVLFPIFDVQGDPVAFGGRILPGGEGAKYWNSTDTPIYNKSKTLYGLNWAKSAIVAADEAIVCEGYTDVIGLAKAGLPRAVATCGTALTEEHFRTLKSFAHRVVLAFDADAAGQNAAARFYEWERAYEIDVAVAALPEGVDPADLARQDPAALVAAVEGATPFLGFRLNRVLDAASLVSPEGRARGAAAAMAVIDEHPDPLVRDQYLMEVASRCRVPVEQLRSGTFARPPSSKASGPDRVGRAVRVDTSPRRPSRRRDSPEVEALRLLVADRDGVSARLDERLFEDEVNLDAYRAVVTTATLHEAVAVAGDGAAELLQRLAVEDTDADADDVLARLVEEAVRRELAVMRAEVGTADEEIVFERSAEMAWLKLRTEEVHDPVTGATAVEQLLAWLASRPQEMR
ncbi:MAG TPA: DNA primase [Acidimicrobiales bacterium]|nr:DNA primase [Acidimicrobiales bacterium]